MGLTASHSETLWQLGSSLPPSSGLAELFEDMENVAGAARGTGLGRIAEQCRPQALGMMEELPCEHWLHLWRHRTTEDGHRSMSLPCNGPCAWPRGHQPQQVLT